MIQRLLTGAAVACAALGLAACTAVHAPRPQATTAAPQPTTAEARDTCGRDVALDVGLLPTLSLRPRGGAQVGRSASVVALDPVACEGAASGAIPTDDCAPDDFPWTISAATRNEELYARGATRVGQATFDLIGRPVLRQTVVLATPGTNLVPSYLAHVRRCGGRTIMRIGGHPELVELGTASGLLLKFEPDRVIALQPLDGRTPSEVVPLMERAAGG